MSLMECLGFSSDLQDFISRHIGSVVELELLLLLRSTAPREWDAAEIARELRIDTAWAVCQAADLCDKGLLACRQGAETLYHYQPADSVAGAFTAQLAEAYADRRVSVIRFIYSRPLKQLKLFSDAFRFWKAKGDG